MPKVVEPAASPWLCKTKAELAERLGIGRNTPSAWQQESPPAPAQLCEFQWRIWAAASSRAVPKEPTDKALIEQLAAAGVQRYRLLLEGQTPAPARKPGEVNLDLVLDPKASLEEQRRVSGYLATQERLMALQERARALIPQADVLAAVEEVGKVFAAQLRNLVEIAAEYSPKLEEQQRLKNLLTDRIEAGCGLIQTRVLAELQKLVEVRQ